MCCKKPTWFCGGKPNSSRPAIVGQWVAGEIGISSGIGAVNVHRTIGPSGSGRPPFGRPGYEDNMTKVSQIESFAQTAYYGDGHSDYNNVWPYDRWWIIYRFAAETGLRASEIASLTRFHFSLEGPNPYVRVEAKFTKNRKEVRQPMPLEIVPEIKKHLEAYPDRQRVLNIGSAHTRIRLFLHDLEAAGIERENEQGETLDFHALRVTYITNLGRSNVSLQMAQKLARHSTPMLTANVYTHAGIEEKSAAVNTLPSIA